MASSLLVSAYSASTSSWAPRPASSYRALPCRMSRCRAASEAPHAADASSLVPRRCTLKELSFSEDGRLITRPSTAHSSRSSDLMELFLATVEASAQVKDLETLTGRLAMVAFFFAIALEYLTGSGVFNTMDQPGLQKALGIGFLLAIGAGVFAVAVRGRKNVTDILTFRCQNLLDSTVDNLVDALFFEDTLVSHSSEEAKAGK